jgi:F-type H+-transporting ATPase subunit gamma
MSAQAKIIRKRIKSVSSTKKITRTMEMVAGAKLRVAQQRVQSSGPYLDELRNLMRDIGGSGLDVGRWPYFEVREGKRSAMLILTSNRGLCGGFNANLLRLGLKTFEAKAAEGWDTKVYVGGRKGVDLARFEGYELSGAFIDEMKDNPQPSDAAFFQNLLTRPFLEDLVDEVCVVYPKWITATRQEPTVLRLLPIAPEEREESDRSEVPPLFEPSPDAILDQLLPLYLRQTVYSILLETVAAEQFARRMAMKLATDNANEIVTNLTREYNKARQALITKELAEILGGSEALK